MTIKSSLKNILLLFFILGAKLRCNKKIKRPQIDINKGQKPKENKLENQYFKEKPQGFSGNIAPKPSFVKKIEKPLNQSKQTLNHPQKTQSEQPDPGVVADIETIQKSSSPEETKTIKQCGHYLVLLHGLSEYASRFSYFEEILKEELEKRGCEDIKFIYPRSREGLASMRSLHVDTVFEEIKNKVDNASVHLIGYSQGVSLLPKLEKLLVNNGNKVSSTYISGALGGIDIIKASYAESGEFAKTCKDILQINPHLKRKKIMYSSLAWPLKGLEFINSDSEHTQEVVEDIRSGSAAVPRLIIGTYASFGDLFCISQEEAKKLDLSYAKLFKKCTSEEVSIEDTMLKNSMKNDTMIPLSSQLARRGSIDEINLAGIGDDGSEIPGPDGCTNTAYHVFPKIAHAGNLPIINFSLYINTENKESSTVLESPKVASRVADFLSKHLGTTTQGE